MIAVQTAERRQRVHEYVPPEPTALINRIAASMRVLAGTSESVDRDALIAAGFSGADLDANWRKAAIRANRQSVRVLPVETSVFVDIHDEADMPAREIAVDLREACPDDFAAAKAALATAGRYRAACGLLVPSRGASQ